MPDNLFAAAPSFPTHPAAELFPMMTADELTELAADIKENGLIHALMLDAAGEYLVDGRNRLAACRLVSIEPRFERLAEGVDARAYIIGVNVARRHLTAGQRAMAVAMVYPEAERGRGNIDPAKKGAESARFSYRRVQEARFVLREGVDLAAAVMAGTKHFEQALTEARQRQNANSSETEQAARLRREAPDLADLLAEERMKLAEALAALDQRIATRNASVAAARKAAERLLPDLRSSIAVIKAAGAYGQKEEILAALDDGSELLGLVGDFCAWLAEPEA